MKDPPMDNRTIIRTQTQIGLAAAEAARRRAQRHGAEPR
jgi:hypothetical protein